MIVIDFLFILPDDILESVAWLVLRALHARLDCKSRSLFLFGISQNSLYDALLQALA